MMRNGFRWRFGVVMAALVVSMVFPLSSSANPVPTGMSTTTLSYTTGDGSPSYGGMRDFSGVGPGDATVLDGAPNIRTFNSVNTFGRRTFVANTGPQFADALGPNESLIAHAFFKLENDNPFFPDIVDNGTVMVDFADIQFDQPVNIDPSTIMMHTLWADPQVSQLSNPYFQVHDHFTQEPSFRNFDDFSDANVFVDFPVANFVLDSDQFDVAINGNGTDTLDLTLTFEYDILRNLEETGQTVPVNLPAPQGFLEPFHFHLEYVVTPEPTSLALLLPAALVAWRPRRTNG